MTAPDEGYQHIEHGFEPVFDERSRVLVLGSFPSVLSRANAFYYGNPQNRFWRVMAACLGAPVPPNEGDSLASGEPVTLDASIAAKRAMLLNGGVALWDVIESCDIKGSSDASIRNVVPAHIERITGAAPIEQVICNGGTAGRIYKSAPGCRPSFCRRQVPPMRRGVWNALSSAGVKPLIGRLFRFSSLSARQDAS